MTSIWDLSEFELRDILSQEPKYRVNQIWHDLYVNNKPVSQMTTIPKELRSRLATDFPDNLQEAKRQVSARKDTTKWLWQLNDQNTIETVLMHYRDRSTVCVSSQAGCAMNCGFCATGQAGYKRNLSVGEILEQVVAARVESAQLSKRLSNIVFMGMGEPFANFDTVMESIDKIIGDFEIGARHITVSTIGLVPQIKRFAELKLQVGLAISLHAANDTLRNTMIPINKRHPIEELIDACQFYNTKTNRRITFEWAMIKDTNDSLEDAKELAVLAKKVKAHVNLIPLNPTPGWPTVGSDRETINRFVDVLTDSRVQATVRTNMGTDISAACGQLNAENQPTPVELSRKTNA